ncbi:MAG: hypothetical protein ACYSUS_09370 [Planctomycetota bacterium]|jgi:hypothetical protein
MRENSCYLFLLLVSAFVTANQTIIPLPELTGSYTNGVQKTTGFDSGLTFSNIDYVEISLSGSYTRGLLMELGTGGYETMDWHLKSTAPLAPELWSTGDIQAWEEGPFSLEEIYYPLTQDATWDLLLNG